MKKVLIMLILIINFTYFKVSAATCDSAELKKLSELAGRVKISHEVEMKTVENENYIIDGGSPTMEVPNIIIDIYNMTDDIFIIASNNYNSTKKTIVYSDTSDGKYKLDTFDNFNGVVEYTFDIYAKNDPCKPRKLKTLTYKKPIENPLYSLEECQKNLDVPFCAQFVTEIDESSDVSNLSKRIEEYRKNSGKNTTTKKSDNDSSFNEFLKKYKFYFIGGTVVIVIGVASFLIIRKGRNEI